MGNRYDRYSGYDFSKFEPLQADYAGSAARKIEKLPSFEEQQKSRMRLVKRRKKTVREAKEEMRAAARRSFKMLAAALVLLTMFAALLYSKLRVDELDRQIQKTQLLLSAAQSESVKLNMRLDSMFSLERVEDYAKNTLGMVKIESYQIEYLDLSGQDRVNLSGGGRADGNGGEKEVTPFSKLLEYIRS